MTPKHRERITNLIDGLNDYELNSLFDRTDVQRDEINAIYTLRRRLEARLKWPVDEN